MTCAARLVTLFLSWWLWRQLGASKGLLHHNTAAHCVTVVACQLWFAQGRRCEIGQHRSLAAAGFLSSSCIVVGLLHAT